MNQSKFSVNRFKNRHGEFVWRVDGRLNGVRIRRNVGSREEAAAEKSALEIKAEQMATDIRSVPTSLRTEQVREAEAAFRRLEGRTRTLLFYLDFALTNYRDPIRDLKLAEAAKEYLALREQDHKHGNLSHRQFTSFRCELRALEKAFPGKTVAELTAPALLEFFKRDAASKKTYNNRRGLVGAFLRHALLKDWVATNVVEKVPHFRGLGHQRGSAPTLTAERCAEIMEWCETNHSGALVPFAALCLFAGKRRSDADPAGGEGGRRRGGDS